jgi:hypothetical protein
MQWPRDKANKQQPYLGNGLVNMFPWQWINNRRTVFSVWSMQRCYNQDSWSKESVDSSVVGYSPNSNDVSTEAEESPLLRPVTRKRLVKADWEDVACALVICGVWRLAIALLLFIVMTWKQSINLFTNPYPVCSHTYTWQYNDFGKTCIRWLLWRCIASIYKKHKFMIHSALYQTLWNMYIEYWYARWIYKCKCHFKTYMR